MWNPRVFAVFHHSSSLEYTVEATYLAHQLFYTRTFHYKIADLWCTIRAKSDVLGIYERFHGSVPGRISNRVNTQNVIFLSFFFKLCHFSTIREWEVMIKLGPSLFNIFD